MDFSPPGQSYLPKIANSNKKISSFYLYFHAHSDKSNNFEILLCTKSSNKKSHICLKLLIYENKDTPNEHIKNLTNRLVVACDSGGWVVMVMVIEWR